uniref:Putative transmembrane ascorbate ferrireductase 2 n=1 Tax=Rhizophora mucronata TaxID=61149 RepID=A0A2P2J8M8_RHIMU
MILITRRYSQISILFERFLRIKLGFTFTIQENNSNHQEYRMDIKDESFVRRVESQASSEMESPCYYQSQHRQSHHPHQPNTRSRNRSRHFDKSPSLLRRCL